MINILLFLASYFFMEFVAWFSHKYIMHGFGWKFHKDHHIKTQGSNSFFEKNDIFFLVYAVPAIILIIFGLLGGHIPMIVIGSGITLFGFTYFFIHDVLIFSIFFPLILSFDKKVRFYRTWSSLFPSIFIVGAVYITADIFFARMGIWGFNPAYHSKIILLGLPFEEWLFFIVIPYSSVFIHYVFISYYPNLVLSDTFVRILTAILIVILLVFTVMNFDKAYTLFNFSLLILALFLAIIDKSRVLNRYYFSFLIILVPFFMVNGILTGTFIPGEVVWYNNSEIIGFRLLTVPVEDIGYAFSLVLLNLLLINRFRSINISGRLKT